MEIFRQLRSDFQFPSSDDPFVIVIIGRKAIKKCFRCLGQGVLVRIIGSRNLHLVTIRVAEIDPGSELGEGFD